MAKIQNPQNEKGQKLASEDYVNESLNASINKFDNTIKNIKGDAEQGLIDVTTEWNEDGHYYETIIAATDNIATKSLFDKQLDNKYCDAGICIEIGGSLNDLQISPKVEASEYKWQPGYETDEKGYPVFWNSSYYRTIASIGSVHYGLDYVYSLLADKIDNLNISSDYLQQINSHINDNSIHITSLEKGLINSALQSDDIALEINTANDSKLVTVGQLTSYVSELNDSTFTVGAGNYISITGDSTKTISVKTNTDVTLNTTESLPTGATIKSAISGAIDTHNTDERHVTAEDRNKIDNYKSIIDTVFNEYGSYNISDDEKENYIISDNWRNPVYMSFADKITNGYRTFGNYGWNKFHIKEMPNLVTQYRMFHNNKFLRSFKCNMPKLTTMEDMFAGCNNLEFIEGDFSSASVTNIKTFTNCNKLKYIKIKLGTVSAALDLLTNIKNNCLNENIKNKKLFLNFNKEELTSTNLTELLNAGWEYNKIESL